MSLNVLKSGVLEPLSKVKSASGLMLQTKDFIPQYQTISQIGEGSSSIKILAPAQSEVEKAKSTLKRKNTDDLFQNLSQAKRIRHQHKGKKTKTKKKTVRKKKNKSKKKAVKKKKKPNKSKIRKTGQKSKKKKSKSKKKSSKAIFDIFNK